MRRATTTLLPLLAGLLLLGAPAAWGQLSDRHDNLPDPVPPPLPKEATTSDAPKYEAIIDDGPDVEWGLPEELLDSLQRTAMIYGDYSRRFICDEEARVADYNDEGEVSKEKSKTYGYLLLRGSVGDPVREFRQNLGKDGKPKGEVDDAEQFPPAYAWVFLFDKFFAPYFDFHLVDKRFEGFDLVYEIHFRGSVPFTDGRDIRQWEGKVLVDAFYFTPLEIEAEPIGQKDRLEGMFRIWSQSFNLLGFRTGKKPFGYKAQLNFGLKKGDLRLPTSLRYDTRRAVGPGEVVIVSASTRTYDNYKFTDVTAENPRIGPVVGQEPPDSP